MRELLEAIECEGAFCIWCGADRSPRHFDTYDAGAVDPRVQFLGSYLVARDSPTWRSSVDEIIRLCRYTEFAPRARSKDPARRVKGVWERRREPSNP